MATLSAKARRYYYDIHYRNSLKRAPIQKVGIPDDIEVREYSTPCFLCGTREGCRHRV